MEELSEKQVWDVLKFANSLNNPYGLGVYTPQLLNQTLIDLNNNPQSATEQKVNRALSTYKSSSKDLQGMNEFMEYTDMLFKRIINFYSNKLSFDLRFFCKNVEDKKDYKTNKYKNDKQVVNDFLNKFKYKAEFKKMVKEMLRRETVFTWLREDEESATLQIMPQKYCELTGYFPKGLCYNFDMSYFLRSGVDIDSYAPVFKDYYNNVFKKINCEPYKQSKTLEGMDNTFALWTEVSSLEGAWAFKFDTSNFNGVPFLSALMKDSVFGDTMRNLQKNKNIISSYKLIIGEIPLMNESKITKPDSFAVDPTTMGQLLSLVRSGVNESFKFGGVPLKEVEEYQYEDKNPNLYNNQNSTTSALGTSASRIIYSTDRLSQSELENCLMEDYCTMETLYSQFENFLEFFINQRTKKYKFRFKFEGSNLLFERQKRQDSVMKLAENGIVLKSAIASAFGYEPQEFEAMLLESESEDFHLESIHTASGKDENKIGKPIQNQVKQSGEKSRDSK